MSAPKALLLLCCVLGLSACGSSQSTQPADTQQAQASPAIEAIDEPAPEAGWTPPPADPATASIHVHWCLRFDESKTDRTDDCTPTPDEVEKSIQMEQMFEQAVQPAKGTEPRAIAQLRLPARGPRARVRLAAWGTQSNKLCVETDEQDEGDSGGGGPSGPCVPGTRCENLCLDLSGSSGSKGVYVYLLSGVVASQADDLRITLDDGREEDFALTGPVVPGFPKYRVFMLDLGRDLYRRLELRHDDKVIAEETQSPSEIRMTRCGEVDPPVHPSQSKATREFDQCVRRAAPK